MAMKEKLEALRRQALEELEKLTLPKELEEAASIEQIELVSLEKKDVAVYKVGGPSGLRKTMS